MRLHHVLAGPSEAPALVLSSSLGTTHEMWEPQLAELAKRWRVVAYDHRGHGGSPAPPGPYSVPELAADVLELLDALGLERVSFCGLSLGGAIGMQLATSAPERIDRLVLACTSARFLDAAAWRERAALVRAEGTEAIADATMTRWFTSDFAHARPEVVARFRALVAATPDEGYAACCEALAGWDFRDDLGGIGAETLVVAGDRDPATPPEHARLIAERVPRSRLVVLDCAHLANVERPLEFTAALQAHLEDREGT